MLRCLIFNVPGVRGGGLAPQASTHSRAGACRAGAGAVASLPTAATWALNHGAPAHTAGAHAKARSGRGQRVVARLSVAPGVTAVTPLNFRELGLSDELLAAVRCVSRAAQSDESKTQLRTSAGGCCLVDSFCRASQVESLGLQRPTEIQAAAVPAILRGGDVVMASHTGSGKTLAFLLPLVRPRLPTSPTHGPHELTAAC
jgi:hypothetical protein